MRLAKMMLVSSMLLVPTMAMGIAQQEQDPATRQQLQQDQQKMQQQNLNQQAEASRSMHGVIVEVRDDSFSVRTDDQGVKWFTITPELKTRYSAELVTGNHIQVWTSPGDSPDRMMATRVARWEGTATADTDTDLDVDIDADSDTATAEFDTDREFEDARVAEAETESQFRDDSTDFDERSELPRTASSLPAVGTLGLLALVGAAVVAIARRF